MTLVLVQVLRAVAALTVAWHHVRHEVGLMAAGGVGAPLAPATWLPWWAGVDLFFVISGFVIVHASGGLFAAPRGRARFLARRAARVVPLYWLVTALYGALALAAPGLLGEAGQLVRDPGFVAASFLFWPAARPDGSVQPLYGLGWTLNDEAFFYVLFALGLGLGRRGALAWLWAALAGLAAAGALAPLPLPLAFWAEPIVLEFALGAALGLARAEGLRLPASARLVLAGLGLAGLALAARALAGGAEAGGAGRLLTAGLPALLLVAAAALAPARDRAEGAVRLPAPVRALAALGDASYALYLVHPFALRLVRAAAGGLGLGPLLHPWGAAALMLGLSIAAALLVHRGFERPATRALRALLEPRPLPAR